MNIIEFLFLVLKVLALISLIIILFDIILDALIIKPIMKRSAEKKEQEIFDLIIEKMKNGEIDTHIVEVDDDNKK